PAKVDDGTDVRRHQKFTRAYGFIRCAEEREDIFRFVDNGVEIGRGDCRIAIHEREVRVYLGKQRDLRALTLRLTQAWNCVQRQIRITTQAVMNLSLTFGFSNQLRQYIDASVQQIAHDMSVV